MNVERPPAPACAVVAARADQAAAVRACVHAAFEKYVARIGKPPGPMRLDPAAAIAAGQVWVMAEGSGGGAVGGVLRLLDTAEGLYIDTVAVRPDCQGLGLGRRLLQFAEAEARRRGHRAVHLCTNLHMTENQVFYPRLGYVETGRAQQDGYDRVFYRKALD